MLIKLCDALFPGKLIENEQEHDIVREDDNLPRLRLLDQPARYTLSPPVVKGGHGIIKHNA